MAKIRAKIFLLQDRGKQHLHCLQSPRLSVRSSRFKVLRRIMSSAGLRSRARTLSSRDYRKHSLWASVAIAAPGHIMTVGGRLPKRTEGPRCLHDSLRLRQVPCRGPPLPSLIFLIWPQSIPPPRCVLAHWHWPCVTKADSRHSCSLGGGWECISSHFSQMLIFTLHIYFLWRNRIQNLLDPLYFLYPRPTDWPNEQTEHEPCQEKRGAGTGDGGNFVQEIHSLACS